MTQAPSVPGVYFEPRPREPEAPFVRTDVVGFVGFEQRVVDGSRPSSLTGGSPATGHWFAVNVKAIDVEVGTVRATVPATRNLVLSSASGSIPIADGQSLAYALAARETEGTLSLFSVPGSVAASGREKAPDDDQVRSAVRAVTDGTTPSQLTGGPPPNGHGFYVDVAPFDLEVGGVRGRVPAETDLELSADPTSIPVEDGEGVVYALAAVDEDSPILRLVVTAGSPKPAGRATAPSRAQVTATVEAVVGSRPWVRIANVVVSRHDDVVRLHISEPGWVRIADIHLARLGEGVGVTVVPRLAPSRLDDWGDFERRFGTGVGDGSLLTRAVHAFFANGGRRCYVATVMRPGFFDAAGLERAREAMVGIKGARERDATGLERLLLIREVSIVDVPDLHASRVDTVTRSLELPGTTEDACFRACDELVVDAVQFEAQGSWPQPEPLFDDAQVFDAQARMLRRCFDERWRVMLLFSVPVEFDPTLGRFGPPSKDRARQWRQRFSALGEEPEKMSCVALYFPWVLSQTRADGPVVEMPPTPFVAAVMARRDLARGPHLAPANETLRGVVGLTQPVDDIVNAELYEPPSNINVLRAFSGFGIQVWGARTLSSDRWLRYVPVRRCLSAIERRAVAALEPLVFEPNAPFLWLQITQQMLSVLLPFFESGALRGSRPEEAFYVRCDESVNPTQRVEAGELVCEVGVAVAAPAEFIVFRIGRREGVVEVME